MPGLGRADHAPRGAGLRGRRRRADRRRSWRTSRRPTRSATAPTRASCCVPYRVDDEPSAARQDAVVRSAAAMPATRSACRSWSSRVVYRRSTESPAELRRAPTRVSSSAPSRRLQPLGADLLKLPFPRASTSAPPARTAGRDGLPASSTAACAGTPWVLLGAGVDTATFLDQIRLAGEAGASGFLAGRGIWGPALAADPDEAGAGRGRDRLPAATSSAAAPWPSVIARPLPAAAPDRGPAPMTPILAGLCDGRSRSRSPSSSSARASRLAGRAPTVAGVMLVGQRDPARRSRSSWRRPCRAVEPSRSFVLPLAAGGRERRRPAPRLHRLPRSGRSAIVSTIALDRGRDRRGHLGPGRPGARAGLGAGPGGRSPSASCWRRRVAARSSRRACRSAAPARCGPPGSPRCAATLFGSGLFLTGHASATLPTAWVLLPGRVVGVAGRRHPARRSPAGCVDPARGAARSSSVTGIVEIVGLTAFAIGARVDIAVTSVLASMFAPIAAVAAFVLFRERLARRQIAGIALVVVGIALLGALGASSHHRSERVDAARLQLELDDAPAGPHAGPPRARDRLGRRVPARGAPPALPRPGVPDRPASARRWPGSHRSTWAPCPTSSAGGRPIAPPCSARPRR